MHHLSSASGHFGGADSDVGIGEIGATIAIDHFGRRYISGVERLAVDAGPLSEDLHSRLQAFITGELPRRSQGAANGHEINIIIIRGRRVGNGIDEAIVLSVWIGQTGGAVHGFVCYQFLIHAPDNRVVRIVILAAIFVLKHFFSQCCHGRCAVSDRLRARNVEHMGGSHGGGQGMEKGIGISKKDRDCMTIGEGRAGAEFLEEGDAGSVGEVIGESIECGGQVAGGRIVGGHNAPWK